MIDGHGLRMEPGEEGIRLTGEGKTRGTCPMCTKGLSALLASPPGLSSMGTWQEGPSLPSVVWPCNLFVCLRQTTCPETHSLDQAALELRELPAFCLSNTVIKGMGRHHGTHNSEL